MKWETAEYYSYYIHSPGLWKSFFYHYISMVYVHMLSCIFQFFPLSRAGSPWDPLSAHLGITVAITIFTAAASSACVCLSFSTTAWRWVLGLQIWTQFFSWQQTHYTFISLTHLCSLTIKCKVCIFSEDIGCTMNPSIYCVILLIKFRHKGTLART